MSAGSVPHEHDVIISPAWVPEAAKRSVGGCRRAHARSAVLMSVVIAVVVAGPGQSAAGRSEPAGTRSSASDEGQGEAPEGRDERPRSARSVDETALAAARDGRDHREEAFAAIIDMIRRDGASLAGAAAIMPDPSDAIQQVEALRGRRFQVGGVLIERSRLQRPWAHVEEWFIRHEDGTPFILFVVETDPQMMVTPVPAGVMMQAPARLYKRIDAVARDGIAYSYIAFVTDAQFVRPVRVTDPAFRSAAPLLALIIMLIPVLLVIRLLLRRVQTRRAIAGYAGEDADETAHADDLPDHPIEALRELRRRAAYDAADRPEGEVHDERR